jgi:hypothetical protein
VAGDHTLVVEAHELDHVAGVVLGLDPTRAEARLGVKDRVVVDPSLLAEARPHVLGKAEVGGVIAVQVTDLPSSRLECELTAAARSCQHTWPGGDLLGDPLGINNGGNHPKAVNKASVSAETVTPVQNGKADITITLEASFQPECSPPMTVTFTDVLVFDQTNGYFLEPFSA